MSLAEQNLDVDSLLTYQIFSILESKFLFRRCGSPNSSDLSVGTSPKTPPPKPLDGRVRILSIDAAADGAILAAVSLVRLENSLKKQAGDPDARIAHYFDVAAGSGFGGILAAMLFTRGADGRPKFTAEESLRFLVGNRRKLRARGVLRKMFSAAPSDAFRKMLGDFTVRDALKPLLIPCYDLVSGSAFMFSRSDAVESDAYDFLMKDVCAATCADGAAVEMRSVDGKTRIKSLGGGAAMANPAAAAITHVLNNKREFPFADGVEDILMVSLGSGTAGDRGRKASTADIARIAGEGAADLIDQSVAMAFGQDIGTNYIRIQANGLTSATGAAEDPVSVAESAILERSVESVMFRGKKVSDHTNGERLDWVSTQLIREQERRKTSAVPTVRIKPAVTTPRTSSATTSTVVTTTTTSTDTSGASPL